MKFTVLAKDEFEALALSPFAATEIWDGPSPDGSFEKIGEHVYMSTPEHFFLRKANELPFFDAVMLGMELCGKYTTGMTSADIEEGTYAFAKKTVTNRKKIKKYLKQISDTPEGKKALKVLKHVRDESCSPMSTYLYMLFCLPKKYGCAGFPKADVSQAYSTSDGFVPSSHGDYLAYDICWPESKVAAQYVNNVPVIADEDMDALETNGMVVHYISKRRLLDFNMLKDAERFLSFNLLGDTTDNIREDAVKKIPFPAFDHMELTMRDIVHHMA